MLAASTALAQRADPPSEATIAANQRAAETAPFADTRDFDFASRGYMGTRTDPVIRTADGRVAMDLNAYDFLKGEAPATVNPSLWRQSQLTARHGLFKVMDSVWQVRGFDTANITFIRGAKGWVVIDALTNSETAQAAYELVSEKLGKRPIAALIYTHSHGDHFGGGEGLKPFLANGAPVLAPVGFFKAAISESVIAGPAMARRAGYQFGMPVAKGPQGTVGVAIGSDIGRGTRGMLRPTAEIAKDGKVMLLDGVKTVFHLTPGTEAPAEMNMYFPDLGVLDLAENANPTQHNVLTPRGALVRDAKAWAEGLSDAAYRFKGARVLITSHGWPRFGQAEVADFLAKHRDIYAYLHDQSIRMMNQGLTGDEIAAKIRLPASLEKEWYNRPYYGSLSFNARAVYQYYMGWYDANPVRLKVLPPEEGGKRYVEAMGGPRRVMELAQQAYDKGDYGWAAELLNRLVFAGGVSSARELLARCYEQLAWQSENALARNIYLTGALELKRGPSVPSRPGDGGFLPILPARDVFDMLATRIDPQKAGEGRLTIRFVFTDKVEAVTVRVANGVLTHRANEAGDTADATVTGARGDILAAVMSGAPLKARIAGDQGALLRLAGWLDQPDPRFAIVTP
nr:alkyl sulfatase dimerization domain-containing protein [Sphingomonas tagetis]